MCQACAHERVYEDLARQNSVAGLFQCQLALRRRHTWVSAWSHMGFSHRRSVLRPLFRMLHGLLRYQRSSALFRPVCLSSTCLSITCLSITFLSWLANRITCASFPRFTLPLLDSLDSKLWYRSGCRAAALGDQQP